jgi:valyl-tRNA synthetase
VKQRAYGPPGDAGGDSARAALQTTLDVVLRLLAPFLPFVTEEVWSWWRDGSVHRSTWPDAGALREAAQDGNPLVYAVAADVLGAVRKAKTASQRSLRTEAEEVAVHDTAERLAALREALDDVREASRAQRVELAEADELAVDVVLAPPDAA